MAITKVNNAMQDALAAAQPTITSVGTLTSLAVDTITIDGNEIDASGSLIFDVGGNLTINVDGSVVSLADDSVNFGQFFNSGSGDFNIYSPTSNKDIVFRGSDGGDPITALTLDMSAAGAATFNAGATFGSTLTVSPDTGATTAFLTLNNGNGNGTLSQINLGYRGDPDHGNIKYTGVMSFQTGGNQTALTLASNGTATFSSTVTSTGLTANVPTGNGLLINSADISTIKMKNTGGGVKNWGFATTNLAAGDFGIYESNSNGGDPITAGAAKLYFNAAGAATFSAGITAPSAAINGQLNVTGTTNSNNIYAQQLSTQFDTSSFMRFHPTSTTNSGGFTNIFFGTDTNNNYGVAIGGKRAGTNGVPTFAVRMLNDATVGTEVLSITNAGAATISNGLTLTDGNLVVANGHGIDFSATAGTGTSELLDDYEEGTWTPTIVSTSGTTSASFTSARNYYTKIGRLVTLTTYIYNINYSGITDGNYIVLGGMPFASGDNYGGTAIAYANGDVESLYLNTNSTYAYLCNDSNGNEYLQNNTNPTTTKFMASITYFTDA